MNFFEKDQKEKLNYCDTLQVISSLSKLFSENDKPFLHYRIMENVFCECFKAKNLSRTDTAYDAKIGTLGVGLKTFLCDKASIEKVAEFNKASVNFKNKDKNSLVETLSNLRNDRIELANTLYGIEQAIYHIIARQRNKLIFFETDYEKIDISNIRDVRENFKNKILTSLSFYDGKNEYFFNFSKSVLQRKFYIPQNYNVLDIQILENPFKILLSLKNKLSGFKESKEKIAGVDFVILPLFSTRNSIKKVPIKSGLNQFNASGRKRNLDEIYIPIPSKIHRYFPNFFPKRNEPFVLKTPLNENLNVKVCQDNSKALMSNPNSALANWLLRKILKLRPGELATMQKLENLGFDSVIIFKNLQNEYEIDIAPLNSYEKFIEEREI